MWYSDVAIMLCHGLIIYINILCEIHNLRVKYLNYCLNYIISFQPVVIFFVQCYNVYNMIKRLTLIMIICVIHCTCAYHILWWWFIYDRSSHILPYSEGYTEGGGVSYINEDHIIAHTTGYYSWWMILDDFKWGNQWFKYRKLVFQKIM